VRRLNWELPDPKDRPLDEVRSIRDAIARRVEDLLVELDAAGATDATRR
jgi:arsenate reductase